MGKIRIEKSYICDSECEGQGMGCKGHDAVLEFNSVANVYYFNDGNGKSMWFDKPLAEALIEMFRFFSETRADSVKV